MSLSSTSAVTLAPHRIAAMVLRYVYLLRSSWTRLLELIYWPAVQLFVWGFLQSHNVPKEVVANVFSNVSTVEFSELAEPNYRGVSVRRCN
jgi:hypothetical protein